MHDDDWPFRYRSENGVLTLPQRAASLESSLTALGKLSAGINRRRSATGSDNPRRTARKGRKEATTMATATKTTGNKPAVKARSRKSTTTTKSAGSSRSTKAKETETALDFTPDAKKPDTQPDDPNKGALRFAEGSDADSILVGTLYIRKTEAKKRYGKLPKGFDVTLTPRF